MERHIKTETDRGTKRDRERDKEGHTGRDRETGDIKGRVNVHLGSGQVPKRKGFIFNDLKLPYNLSSSISQPQPPISPVTISSHIQEKKTELCGN